MNNLLLSSYSMPVLVLGALVIICAIALIVAYIVAIGLIINVVVKYKKYNKINTARGLPADENARYMLDQQGLNDVKVKKCGFWSTLLGYSMFGYGNSYTKSKKTLFLRKNILENSSITAIAVSSQKVGHAVLDKENDSDFNLVSKLRPICLWGPVSFVPILILATLLDIFVFKTSGIAILITALFAFVYLIASFVFMLKTIPVEKKANEIALENLRKTGMYTDEELEQMKIVLDSYIKYYIAVFVYSSIEIVYELLYIIFKILVIYSKVKKD